MDKIDAIIEIVANKWETSDIVHAWNLMLEGKEVRCKIFPMSSFNEMFNGKSHLEVIKMVHNCQFGVDDDYFSFNAEGYIESFSDINDFSAFSYYDLADYLADKGDSLTKEVDSDELLDYFVEEYFGNYDFDQIKCVIETYMEDNTFDLVMDNWDDLNEYILNYIKEEGLGSNEEDDEDNDDEDSNDFINRLLMEEAEKEKEDKD